MSRLTPSAIDWVTAGAIALAAWLAPVPLYVLALALFGLPHVIWEIAWIRTATADRLPWSWWRLLIGVLLLQAAGRAAALFGWIGADLAGAVDLLTLALAVGLVAFLPTTGSASDALRLRGLGIVGSLALAWIVFAGDLQTVMAALVVLSIAHNFTPVLLQTLGRRNPTKASWSLGAMFVLPLLTLFLPESQVAAALIDEIPWRPAEIAWLGDTPMNVLSALVLAQCLHYLAVIRVLPRHMGNAWSAAPWLWPALGATALLAIGFAMSFPDARRVYAIAAGFHAWLEWPILLALVGTIGAKLGQSPRLIEDVK